jgi:SAM-dependent methyltransferase
MTKLEERIYNEGERLIPGITHDLTELVRHVSSYRFFSRVVEHDLRSLPDRPRPARIMDLGCGVGFGCRMMAALPDTAIKGVDVSAASIDYARCHYGTANITLERADLAEYVRRMPEYDYVLSRNVFEHIPHGLDLARATRWRNRLLFDVPYDEGEGNPHHVLHRIREDAFRDFPDAELFYQDLAGVTYDARAKPERPNLIICVCSRPGLPKVAGLMQFPLAAWTPQPASDLVALPQKAGIVATELPAVGTPQRCFLDRLLHSTCDRRSYVFLTRADYESRLGWSCNSHYDIELPNESRAEPALMPPPRFHCLQPESDCKPAGSVLVKRLGLSRIAAFSDNFFWLLRRAKSIALALEEERCGAALALGDDFLDLPATCIAARQVGIPFFAYVGGEDGPRTPASKRGLATRWAHAQALRRSAGVLVPDGATAGRVQRQNRIEAIALSASVEDADESKAAEVVRLVMHGLLENASARGRFFFRRTNRAA